MLRQFIELLPYEAPQTVFMTILVTAGVGAVLWVAGAKFSRFFTTLLTVALGAVVGMQLPKWFAWNIGGAAPSVGAAVILGVTGYVLHGMWMGLLLGVTFAFWATFITWCFVGDGQPITWPVWTDATTPWAYLLALRDGMPTAMQRMAPFFAAAALVSGLACCILWTRLTTLLAWSATGLTLFAGGVVFAIRVNKPHWLASGLPNTAVQAAVLIGALLLGVLIQSQLAPPPKKRKPQSKETPDAKADKVPAFYAQ